MTLPLKQRCFEDFSEMLSLEKKVLEDFPKVGTLMSNDGSSRMVRPRLYCHIFNEQQNSFPLNFLWNTTLSLALPNICEVGEVCEPPVWEPRCSSYVQKRVTHSLSEWVNPHQSLRVLPNSKGTNKKKNRKVGLCPVTGSHCQSHFLSEIFQPLLEVRCNT